MYYSVSTSILYGQRLTQKNAWCFLVATTDIDVTDSAEAPVQAMCLMTAISFLVSHQVQ
jgi:hypothetical protein